MFVLILGLTQVITWLLPWYLSVVTWDSGLVFVYFGPELGICFLYLGLDYLGVELDSPPLLGICLYFCQTWTSTCLVFMWNLGLIRLGFSGLFVFIWDLIQDLLWDVSVFTWNLNHLGFLRTCLYWFEGRDSRFTSYLYNNGLFQSFAWHSHIQGVIANSKIAISLQNLLLKIYYWILFDYKSISPSPCSSSPLIYYPFFC